MPETPDDNNASGSSQEDFVEVFTEHSRQIYRFILTLTTNRADTDDVFQATSIVLLKKFGEFDPSIGSFYSWACRIAYLEVLNMRRAKRRATMLSEEVLEMLHADLMRRTSDLNSREAVLEECLKKLSDEERHLIEDRYFHEYTPKQLARRENCSVHAIYRSLAKVHGMLRRCVDRSFAAENR